jgi:kynurenine formamidase
MSWSPQLIDLTRPMTHDTIVGLAGKFAEPGSPYSDIEFSYLRSWDTDNGSVCQWKLNDHFGTHLDAPIHIVPNTPGVDGVEIDRLIGEAVVIDCSFANGRGITSEDFERAQPRVKAGDIVLIYSAEQPATSMDDYIRNQTFVTPDGAEWLVKQNIKSVGVEPYGFEHLYEGIFVHKWYDKSTPPPHWPAHTICLQKNVYILEGLGNLESLVGRRVRFSALPLPVPDSSGSPVRAVAWEED